VKRGSRAWIQGGKNVRIRTSVHGRGERSRADAIRVKVRSGTDGLKHQAFGLPEGEGLQAP
jgi:hypothetical protein